MHVEKFTICVPENGCWMPYLLPVELPEELEKVNNDLLLELLTDKICNTFQVDKAVANAIIVKSIF